MNKMPLVDDYLAVAVISVFSGFGGAVGAELARFVLNKAKERINHAKPA